MSKSNLINNNPPNLKLDIWYDSVENKVVAGIRDYAGSLDIYEKNIVDKGIVKIPTSKLNGKTLTYNTLGGTNYIFGEMTEEGTFSLSNPTKGYTYRGYIRYKNESNGRNMPIHSTTQLSI